eukprot:1159873-Pelagomonas_calceolata.AAC.2
MCGYACITLLAGAPWKCAVPNQGVPRRATMSYQCTDCSHRLQVPQVASIYQIRALCTQHARPACTIASFNRRARSNGCRHSDLPHTHIHYSLRVNAHMHAHWVIGPPSLAVHDLAPAPWRGRSRCCCVLPLARRCAWCRGRPLLRGSAASIHPLLTARVPAAAVAAAVVSRVHDSINQRDKAKGLMQEGTEERGMQCRSQCVHKSKLLSLSALEYGEASTHAPSGKRCASHALGTLPPCKVGSA